MRRIALIVAASAFLLTACADTISTTLTLRVSKLTQNAVINVGEDLTMEVGINGAVPASYQWYFNNTAIEGADQRAYTIGNAVVEDTGIYRMDAFDTDGKLIVSMDISARVIDKTVPETGDKSLSYGAVLTAMGAALATLTAVKRRKTAA